MSLMDTIIPEDEFDVKFMDYKKLYEYDVADLIKVARYMTEKDADLIGLAVDKQGYAYFESFKALLPRSAKKGNIDIDITIAVVNTYLLFAGKTVRVSYEENDDGEIHLLVIEEDGRETPVEEFLNNEE